MKLATTALLGAAALLVGLPHAHADDGFTAWKYAADTTPRGAALCALATAGSKNQVTRNIVVKAFAGKQSLSITMYKGSWAIPSGTNVPIQLDFLDGQPLSLGAYGDGKVVDIELPTGATATFLSLLNSERALRVSFARGNEPAWTVGLAGIKPELKRFVECAKSLGTKPY